MDYLFDTNHASKILEGNKSLSLNVNALKNSGSRFGISVSILGELFFAVYASKRKEENLLQLKGFLEDVILWDYDVIAAEEFGKIQAEQKAKGMPIPSIDAQIAAVARIHNITILTTDRHFGIVDDISVENWLF
ncbi:MAG TPA: type II toxin-antitoxin system VapC family toxin [Candidatus Brocadiia bacterium]|nr:type II toxin-antitoxin system VapC family toxin [Candidatus Brocadiales bacterium]